MNAKYKLSKNAISRIIQLRAKRDKHYTFADMSDVIEQEFGVRVAINTIAYHCKRNSALVSADSDVNPIKETQSLLEERNNIKERLQAAKNNASTSEDIFPEISDEEYQRMWGKT